MQILEPPDELMKVQRNLDRGVFLYTDRLELMESSGRKAAIQYQQRITKKYVEKNLKKLLVQGLW